MSNIVAGLYEKHAPVWIKCIRWEARYQAIVKNIPSYKIIFVAAVGTLTGINFYPNHLALSRPKTEEERLFIKRQYAGRHINHRNWDYGQYEFGAPPRYDLWERRQKYPEYYAGRYDGFKRYGEAVLPK